MGYDVTTWDPYQKYNNYKHERMQRRAPRFVKSRYTRYSDMHYELGWPPLSRNRQDAPLILFYKIINSFGQVPFEWVIIRAYKNTRRKHNIKFK